MPLRKVLFFTCIFFSFSNLCYSASKSRDLKTAPANANKSLTIFTYSIPINAYEKLNLLLKQNKFLLIYNHYHLDFYSQNLEVEKDYYDSEDLVLLGMDKSLYYVKRNSVKKISTMAKELNKTDLDKRIILSNKFNSFNYDLRRKKNVISPIDKHPLLGKIKRSQRISLIKQLKTLNIKNIFSLKKILTINTQSFSHYLSFNNDFFALLTFNIKTAKSLARETTYLELVVKFNSDNVSKSELDVNQLVKEILSFTQLELKKDTNQPYKKGVLKLSESNYFFKTFITYPLFFKLLQITFYCMVGAGLLYLFLGKRKQF